MSSLNMMKLGSGYWICAEQLEINRITNEVIEDFTYSVRDEAEWLREHRRDVLDSISSKNINMVELLKTPSRLRGRIAPPPPSTRRKRKSAEKRTEKRQPLGEMFASVNERRSPTPHVQSLSPHVSESDGGVLLAGKDSASQRTSDGGVAIHVESPPPQRIPDEAGPIEVASVDAMEVDPTPTASPAEPVVRKSSLSFAGLAKRDLATTTQSSTQRLTERITALGSSQPRTAARPLPAQAAQKASPAPRTLKAPTPVKPGLTAQPGQRSLKAPTPVKIPATAKSAQAAKPAEVLPRAAKAGKEAQGKAKAKPAPVSIRVASQRELEQRKNGPASQVKPADKGAISQTAVPVEKAASASKKTGNKAGAKTAATSTASMNKAFAAAARKKEQMEREAKRKAERQRAASAATVAAAATAAADDPKRAADLAAIERRRQQNAKRLQSPGLQSSGMQSSSRHLPSQWTRPGPSAPRASTKRSRADDSDEVESFVIRTPPQKVALYEQHQQHEAKRQKRQDSLESVFEPKWVGKQVARRSADEETVAGQDTVMESIEEPQLPAATAAASDSGNDTDIWLSEIETDDEANGGQSSKKKRKYPSWTEPDRLEAQLQLQADWDIEQIFPRRMLKRTVDLDEIFPNHPDAEMLRRRGSSGDWSKDGLKD
ncbi:MAG: hypothetical protein M1825_002523 [Sarcosagium campestre]|nr:MAG: hypothetical protein M1825_002523 [Sarcosagium campestre]